MMLFIAILLVSLYASGMMMTHQIRGTYEDEVSDQLKTMAGELAETVVHYQDGEISREILQGTIERKADGSQNVIWVILSDGTLLSAGTLMPGLRQPTAEEIENYFPEMMAELAKGNIVTQTSEQNNLLRTPAITLGMAVQGDGISYVFVNRYTSALNASLRSVYRQIMLSVAIAALVATVLTYFFTRNMLRPLAVVSKGANQLSQGRFDVGLEVRSQDEIGQLARTFNTLALDLAKYEQTKDSFVANVSHELRSPLTSMQGLLQGVMDGTIPQEESAHYIDVVLGETKRLNILINDLLDLARMQAGQFPVEIEKMDINETIRRVLITFESKIDAKHLDVEVEFEHDCEMVYADANRIYQVIQNILDNAIKFVPEKGLLRIASVTSGGHAYISINNSGKPISQDELSMLFDRFYKADKNRPRTVEGTGIGLSIVKKIIEEHHQKIWVESDKATGTTFTFTLKLL